MISMEIVFRTKSLNVVSATLGITLITVWTDISLKSMEMITKMSRQTSQNLPPSRLMLIGKVLSSVQCATTLATATPGSASTGTRNTQRLLTRFHSLTQPPPLQ